MDIKECDKKLMKILKGITPSWDGEGYSSIIELEKAIKSKYKSDKEYVIKKYEQRSRF